MCWLRKVQEVEHENTPYALSATDLMPTTAVCVVLISSVFEINTSHQQAGRAFRGVHVPFQVPVKINLTVLLYK
jgi:hypothetical protein